jgi:UDP-2-acetamido-2-deoxy-ribo-hexuluronate aminotransferase
MEAELKKRGIPTAIHYPIPLHLQPVFANLGLGQGSFPVAERIGQRVLSLPMHPYLTEEQQVTVVDALGEAVDAATRTR